MQIAIRATLATFALVVVSSAWGQAPVRETRRHWEVVSRSGKTVYYTVTELNRFSETEDRTVYLVEDTKGNRYEMSSTMSYWKQENEKLIRDLRRKTFIRQTYRYPLKAKTRSETIAEARRTGASARHDPTVVVETESTSREATQSQWMDDENARLWRSELRTMTDPTLLDALEGMRAILFSQLNLQVLCQQLVMRFLYGDSCTKASIASVKVAMPDCFFDTRFGYPCSPSQKVRVAEAARESTVLLEQYAVSFF
jgi:hypothetical protein